jgi:hypothetical protein
MAALRRAAAGAGRSTSVIAMAREASAAIAPAAYAALLVVMPHS